MEFSVKVEASTRYSFTGQFLEGAALFARKAREIEKANPLSASTPDLARAEHRALVTTCIMQSAAALETEAYEICVHGPGSHLGSDNTDLESHKLLHPLADIIDEQSTLRRYELILHFLGKPPLDKGRDPYQSAQLMVRLRNALVHYKSQWAPEMSDDKFLKALESLGHKAAPFFASGRNFFPHRCLSADCAAWAVTSAVRFLESYYVMLGVRSRFEKYGHRLQP